MLNVYVVKRIVYGLLPSSLLICLFVNNADFVVFIIYSFCLIKSPIIRSVVCLFVNNADFVVLIFDLHYLILIILSLAVL